MRSSVFPIVLFSCFSFTFETSSLETDSPGWRRVDTSVGSLCAMGYRIGANISLGDQKFVEFNDPFVLKRNNDSSLPLTMCVLNQRSGRVISYEKFPLYELYAVWKDLERYLKNISPENIVILQTGGSSSNGVRNATQILSTLGSVMVKYLEEDTIWTWVYVNGGKTLFEKLSRRDSWKELYVPLSNTWLPISTLPRPIMGSEKIDSWRWKYCEQYGGMGDLCDESQPGLIGNNFTNIDSKVGSDVILSSIPVIISAGVRPAYLYQSLKSFINAKQSIKENFHVYLGTKHHPTIRLLYLLNITYTYIPPSIYGSDSFFPIRFYGEMFQDVYFRHENASYVIILEEDIEVSKDFFLYMKHSVPLLDKDPSLYCVTGFSATGLKFLAYNESQLLRADVQVGWGYALKREFLKEALLKWPNYELARVSQYDAFIYGKVRGKRECILPEVSRSLHYGIGLNTVYMTTEKVFLTQPIAKEENISYTELDKLVLTNWRSDMRSQISKATPIENNICRNEIQLELREKAYIMCYNYSKETDNQTFPNFSMLANCFKAWSYSLQGQHDFVYTTRFSANTTIYLVAHPESSFSDLCPDWQEPFDRRNLTYSDYFIYATVSNAARHLNYFDYTHPGKIDSFAGSICEIGYPFGVVSAIGSARKLMDIHNEFILKKKSEVKIPLTMCVLDHRSGNAIFHQIFPLYELYSVWIDLERYLKNISPENIVVLQTGGSSVPGLRNATKALSSFGSCMVEYLEDDCVWTWVYVNGGKTIFEKLSRRESWKQIYTSSSNSVLLLSHLSKPKINATNHLERERWKFCGEYGLMGDLCDESKPGPIGNDFENNDSFDDPVINSIPVIITGGIRPTYLYQSLKSYIRAAGSVKENFHVYLGSYYQPTKTLLRLLNIKYTYISPSTYASETFFSFRYYFMLFRDVYFRYRNASHFIFLEEDISVSSDFFLYMKHALPLLDVDKTLYCIAGFSATGLKYLAHDESALLRGDVQVGWGYAITREFIKEALYAWPETSSRNSQYDAFLHQKVKKDRECIFPEVSRTLHYGIGINTQYILTEKVFLSQPSASSLNVSYTKRENLVLPKWKEKLRKHLSTCKYIEGNVCRENVSHHLKNNSYMICYNYTNQLHTINFKNFQLLANCFKAWSESMQGQHDHVHKIQLSRETEVYLVAHPQSSFSDLCSSNPPPFDAVNLPSSELAVYKKVGKWVKKLGYFAYMSTSIKSIRREFFQA